MQPEPDILLIHSGNASWRDLTDALGSVRLNVEAISSAAQAVQRIQNRPPDVVLLDCHFEHGVDLLLKARQTVAGMVVIVVRKSRGRENLYDATFPGESPRYVEPADPHVLAETLRAALISPAAPPAWPP